MILSIKEEFKMTKQRLYGLRYDPLFKTIYFEKENLKKLMKDLFHEELEDFHYEKQELPKGNVNLQSGVCDLVMKSKKRILLLEIQNKDLKNLVERVKYYSSEFYANQNPGNDYKKLLPVEVYLIINFSFGKKQVLKEYEEFEKILKEQLGNVSKIKIWNIKEALKEKKGLDYDYARLFTLDDKGVKEKGQSVIEELSHKEELKHLVKKIQYYNTDKEIYQRLKEVEKMEMTFEQATAGFRREGIEIGEKRGEKIGKLKTALSMLQEGLEISLIKKVTGLTEKQIMNSENELSKK